MISRIVEHLIVNNGMCIKMGTPGKGKVESFKSRTTLTGSEGSLSLIYTLHLRVASPSKNNLQWHLSTMCCCTDSTEL